MESEFEPVEARSRVFRGKSQRVVLEAMMAWERKEGHFINVITVEPPNIYDDESDDYSLDVYYSDINVGIGHQP